MAGRLKVAAVIVKETFAHPLTKSVIRVNDGNVQVEREDAHEEPEGEHAQA